MCSNGEAAARDHLRQVLGDLLRDDGLLVLAQRRGAPLDPGGLGLHAGADRVRLGGPLRPDRVRLGLAVEPGRRRLGLGLHLGRRGLRLGLHLRLGRGGLGVEADLLGLGLGLADARVAGRRGQRGLAIRLGVGGLAHVDLELLLLLLRLRARRRGSARSTTACRALASDSGPCCSDSLRRLVDLGLEAGLLDLGVRIDSAIWACAVCSCATACLSAFARAMRAFCSTSA